MRKSIFKLSFKQNFGSYPHSSRFNLEEKTALRRLAEGAGFCELKIV